LTIDDAVLVVVVVAVVVYACRGGSSKLIDRGSYRVKGAYPISRARGDNHVRIS